jgi:hypothetical protein
MEKGSLDRRRREMKESMKPGCEAIQSMQATGMILYHQYLDVVTVTTDSQDSIPDMLPVAKL